MRSAEWQRWWSHQRAALAGVYAVSVSAALAFFYAACTFDELYGRDGHFLDGLDQRNEAFVGEIPPNFHVWLNQSKVLRKPTRNDRRRPSRRVRLKRRGGKTSEVRNLARYSPAFHQQKAQRYRIKETGKGPDVWEITWVPCWPKTHTDKAVIPAKKVWRGCNRFCYRSRTTARHVSSCRIIPPCILARSVAQDMMNSFDDHPGIPPKSNHSNGQTSSANARSRLLVVVGIALIGCVSVIVYLWRPSPPQTAPEERRTNDDRWTRRTVAAEPLLPTESIFDLCNVS